MKVFLAISHHKKRIALYQPYIFALLSNLEVTSLMDDADVVIVLGAWIQSSARVARQARKMGIPYIVCPLGDISDRNRHNPGIRRPLQTLLYQKSMVRNAAAVVVTTPLEQKYLLALGWNANVVLIRNYACSHLVNLQQMLEVWIDKAKEVLCNYESCKAEDIARLSKLPIAQQLLQIKSRMPHRNIPLSYLTDLHNLLYADNYDEDDLSLEFKKLDISAYAASVFQVMSQTTGLTEGFMPIPAKQGSLAKKIMKYVK